MDRGMIARRQRDYQSVRSLAAQQMWGVRLQADRLRSGWWTEGRRFAEGRADFEFLIGALWRLRRAVLMAQAIEPLAVSIAAMVEDFDSALPVLKRLRNVGEHFDSQTIGVDVIDLLGASQQADAFSWLGQRVIYADAERAAASLFRRLRDAASLIGADPEPHPLEPS